MKVRVRVHFKSGGKRYIDLKEGQGQKKMGLGLNSKRATTITTLFLDLGYITEKSAIPFCGGCIPSRLLR